MNEIRDCAHSPRGECTSTGINAKNFQIPALRESDYPAKAVVYSVTENFTAILKTKAVMSYRTECRQQPLAFKMIEILLTLHPSQHFVFRRLGFIILH